MMNEERAILETLTPCHPRGLRERALLGEVANYGAKLSLTDLRRHVTALEAKSHVLVVATEDFTLIKITAEGLARISE
jgi:hypothetical protein